MDKNDIQKLIQDEIMKYMKQSQFNVSPVPYHTHNGIDSPIISTASTGSTALIVTDGSHTVNPTSTISFTGAVVTNAGGGEADVAVSGAAGGADTQVQFNNSGALDGDVNFKWDAPSQNLILNQNAFIQPSNKSGTGYSLAVESGNSSGGNGVGGAAAFGAGDGNGSGSGGEAQFFGGSGGGGAAAGLTSQLRLAGSLAAGAGGSVDLHGGDGGTTGKGGDVVITAGSALGGDSNGGNMTITAGVGHGANFGGAAILQGANGGATGGGGDASMSAGSGGAGGGDGGEALVEPGSSSAANAGDIHLKLHTGSTRNSRVVIGTAPTASYRAIGTLNTTDNSYHSVSDVFAMSSGSAGYVHARVVGHRTGGSAGTANDSFAAEFVVGTKNVGGTASLQTAITYEYLFGDQGAWDAKFVASGGSVLLQVKGATNNNVSWQYEIWYMNV